jgi:arylsulfatase A-like enzyme
VTRAGTRDALEWVDRHDEEIAYTDREIGRLLDAYRALGYGGNAAVLFTSDHGETMREGEEWFAHGYHVYEPILRVPLALRAPGLTARRADTAVSLVDVTPTLLALAGIEIPEGLDGASLLRDDLSGPPSMAKPLPATRASGAPSFGTVRSGWQRCSARVLWESAGGFRSIAAAGRDPGSHGRRPPPPPPSSSG